jgi:hypothetical protein
MSESSLRRLGAIGLAHLYGTDELLPALKKWREERDKEKEERDKSYQEYLQQHPEIRRKHLLHKIMKEARIKAEEEEEAREAALAAQEEANKPQR